MGILHKRMNMEGCLLNAAGIGLNPKTIIDVGAANGTPAIYKIFPKANHILVEPLKEYTSSLESVIEKLDKAEYILAAASDRSGEVVINVHPDLVGSSLFLEDEDSDVNGYERTVPAVTLDEIAVQKKIEAPCLIKVDAQGSELKVLNGAAVLLKETELVILEVSFYKVFKGGPQIIDCIEFMKKNNFIPYDMFDPLYRPLDGALFQVDIAFVPENSILRRQHFYATKQQRDIQNREFGKILNIG